MNTINERVMFLIHELGYNKNSFSKAIDQLSSAVIENIVGKRKSKPGFDILSKIIRKFPEINADWLLTGRGRVYKVDPKKTDIIEFRKNFNPQYNNDYVWNPDKSHEIEELKQKNEILQSRIQSMEKQLEDKERTISTMQKLIDVLEKSKG